MVEALSRTRHQKVCSQTRATAYLPFVFLELVETRRKTRETYSRECQERTARLVYIAGELSSVGVHALSSEAEGQNDRSAGVGAAVVQGLYFSVVTSAVIAFLATDARLRDASSSSK